MSVTPAWKVEIGPVGWTEITTDVLQSVPIKVKYGITSGRYDDRCADVGYMNFALDNSAFNSVGTAGRYSPGGAGALSSFIPGLLTKLSITYAGTTYVKFYGWVDVDGIQVDTGSTGKRRTYVSCKDWLGYPASTELGQIPYADDQRIGDIVGAVDSAMPIQSGAQDFDGGMSVFEASYDGEANGVKGLTELNRVANSEWGYVYLYYQQGIALSRLRAESRHTRNEIMRNNAPVITLDNNMLAGQAPIVPFYNAVKVKVTPRRADGDYVTLYSLQSPQFLRAGGTVAVVGRYTDPQNTDTYVTAKYMDAMAATTDYTFNTIANGQGTDLTTDLTVTEQYGANSAYIHLVNAGTVDGYVTKLQCRGKGIYRDRPIEYTAQYVYAQGPPDSPDGSNLYAIYDNIYIDMRYQDSLEEGATIADYIYNKIVYQVTKTKFSSVTFYPNKSDALMTAFLNADVGSHIRITEDITGESGDDYFINGVSFDISANNLIRCTWYVQWDSENTAYWILGVAGRSELDATANPAP